MNPTSASRRVRKRTQSFLRRHRARILADAGGQVVIVADDTSEAAIAEWRRAAPGRIQVIVLDSKREASPADAEAESGPEGDLVAADIREASRLCKRFGQIDVLVDATGGTSGQRVVLWEWLFFHVRAGGYYIAAGDTDEPAWVTSIDLNGITHKSERELTELRLSLAQDRLLTDGLVVFHKSIQHLFKVHEEQADDLLPLRAPDLQVESLGHLPGGSRASSVAVFQHGDRQTLPSTEIRYSSAEIRHYRGRIHLADDMLTLAGTSVLPPSFRHPWVDNLKNESLRNINWEFAVYPKETAATEALAGDFYDLNPSIPGHFGHILTESVAKLWGWSEAKRRLPDLKAICRIPSHDYDPTVETALFTAHGIAESDIHFETRDVLVESLVSSTLLWQNNSPYQYHPHIETTWAGLRSALTSTAPEGPELLFVSRRYSEENRLCRNADAVERLFEEHGFTIVHPEKLSFAEQAATFASARVVAGFAGSGMFNILFSARLEKLIVLSQDSYSARNEFLYATSLAREIHYFWSKADRRHPGRFSVEAFHSPWEFDFQRDGADLTALLETVEPPR